MHWRRKWQATPVFLLGETQGGGAWWAALYGVTQSQTRLKSDLAAAAWYVCEMMDVNEIYMGNHFTMFISQTITMYTLNIHSVLVNYIST